MTSAALLTTKLFVPPPRRNLVPRPRLIQQLEEGLSLGSRLSVVSAPAGSGKTTLLSDWISQRGKPVAWLSLDEQDNDASGFWRYVIGALQVVRANLGQESLALLQAARPTPVRGIVLPLLNEIAESAQNDPAGELLLVLDDYHHIARAQIHEGISFLLEHQPPNLHVVISTRADPPLPLYRLRARGQLTELRASDLRFTPQEAAMFLIKVMGLNLTQADVEALEGRTEGWIVGLQLAALALQSRADVKEFIAGFAGSHHYVLEYLTEEVLSCQTERVRQFLLQTSFLDRLCGPLCDAVLGLEQPVGPQVPGAQDAGQQGSEMLAQLDRANLFVVPLDVQHEWYRYHGLFADLLRKKLGLQMTQEQVADLHRRASAWHEGQGSLDEAVLYALRAGDHERVVRLVEQAASAGRLERRLTTMLGWLEAVPREMLHIRPRLSIYQTWALVINEQLDMAQKLLRQSSEALQAMPSSPQTSDLRAGLEALLSLVDGMVSVLALAYGGANLEEAYGAALALRDRALEENNIYLAGHATNGLAMARFHQSRLREAAEHYRTLVDLGVSGGVSQIPLAAVGHVGLATICLERNELDEAARHLDEGLRLGRHRVGANTSVSAAITESRLKQIAGDGAGALRVLADVERLGHVRDSVPAMHRLARQRAWLRLSAGDVAGAEYLVKRLQGAFGPGKPDERLAPVFQEAHKIWLARLQIARDQARAALEVLGPLHEQATATGRFGRVIEICLLEALAWQLLGDSSAAAKSFRRSLVLAAPERVVRPFLDEGERLVPLLSFLAQEAETPRLVRQHAQRLRDALAAQEDGRPPRSARPDTSLASVEALTPRERQVLRLIGAGLTSVEIADELVIAVSTARTHIKNIYSKLGVHSRYEAIERAGQLRLL